MENYKCRYCFKSFANGRALGGHMRSHMPSLHVDEERPSQLSYETTESDVSSSSSKEKRNGKKKKNDPKFASTSSLLLLEDEEGDDESETESSRNVINLTRKRSKRTRKLDSFATKKKKVKTSQLGYKPAESDPEPPHSSASDTTTEEDLAFCLMMLSRDKWKKNKSSNNKDVVEEIETGEEEEEEGYNNRLSKMNRTTTTTTKGRYKCETCGKVFKSYQALGGHRASHKKNRVSNKTEQQRSETEHDNVVVVVAAAAAEKRIHECPICFRVFASGQALGGHKRSHGIGNLSTNHHHQAHHQIESVKQRMIDLNLPAPTEEDEVSVVFQ
ncbi:PREDICTED: zinc finger protein ZAT9-like [Camelina sativa]|uniref:Zinc finger protein ZAT9-like n=1 Tax=Camelina sativa TaxID=90675 RepID=A0ABM0SMU5_CAMSA|nr:PREDICTED: zinc finger protein ZAT9-like [Camelina sativa]